MSEKAEDIAANEDAAEPSWVDAKEDLAWAFEKAEVDEVLEEEVQGGTDEDGRDDDE